MLSRYSLALLLVLAPMACGGPQVGAGSTVTQAAVGTGLAVAAAGLNRAVNHECWAACRSGMVCDQASGLCVEQGMARMPKQPRGSALEPVAANEPGHEYEVPALATCNDDAGLCGDAGGDAAAR
jgi:hypothetical protein